MKDVNDVLNGKNLDDIGEIKEAHSLQEANQYLQHGWKLLGHYSETVQKTQVRYEEEEWGPLGLFGGSEKPVPIVNEELRVVYVLGRPRHKPDVVKF